MAAILDPCTGPDSVLELRHCSAWSSEPELEPEAWFGDEGFEDPEADAGLGAFGIPEPEAELGAEPPTKAWNLGRAVAATISWAAVVPMLLSATPALAGPGSDATPTPTPSSTEAPPAPTPAQDPAQDPSQDPPGPTRVVDAALVWDTLKDHRVVLTMVDGTSVRATVLGMADSVLVCAAEADGQIFFLDPDEIATAHVADLPGMPAPAKPQTGQGMIVFGSIATALGGALAVASAVTAGYCAASYYGYLCPYMTVPIGVASIVNLSVGIPFLATGVRKRKRHRAASEDGPSVSAYVAPSREGVMGGVGVRF